MQNISSKNKNKRLSILVNADLAKKLNEYSEKTNQSLSDIAREALRNYLLQVEKEKANKELAEGYKANYEYYLKTQNDWDYADKEKTGLVSQVK